MRRVMGSAGLAVLALLGTVGCASNGALSDASMSRLSIHDSRVPAWFVAQYNHGAGDAGGGSPDYLSAFSTAHGRRLANLLDLDRLTGQLQLNSLDQGPRGAIWLVMASGPTIQGGGGLANPPTVPNSCRGELLRLNPATGRLSDVWNAPHDEYLVGGQLAPDNKRFAFIAGHCTNNVPAEPVQILTLSTGHLSIIGADTACGQLTFQAWSPNSRQVIVRATASSESAAVANGPPCRHVSEWRTLGASGPASLAGRPLVFPTDRGWTISDLTALRGSLLIAETHARRGSKACRLRTLVRHASHLSTPVTVPGPCHSIALDPGAKRNAALVIVDRSSATTAIGIYTAGDYRAVRAYTLPTTFLASIAW
jgi:hypothetical protein